jgi:hypothetical protein
MRCLHLGLRLSLSLGVRMCHGKGPGLGLRLRPRLQALGLGPRLQQRYKLVDSERRARLATVPVVGVVNDVDVGLGDG